MQTISSIALFISHLKAEFVIDHDQLPRLIKLGRDNYILVLEYLDLNTGGYHNLNSILLYGVKIEFDDNLSGDDFVIE